jgi:hypothetical protein
MKKKSITAKLQLQTETIQALQASDLTNVAGGYAPSQVCTRFTCPPPGTRLCPQ